MELNYIDIGVNLTGKQFDSDRDQIVEQSLAGEVSLPLFLHERAADDFSRLMKSHREVCKRSVVHCFTGTRTAAYKYLQIGCRVPPEYLAVSEAES